MNARSEAPSTVRLERIISLHPKVRACAVLTTQHALRGEQTMAIVEPAAREQLTSRELLAFLRGQLSPAGVPDGIIIVVELPRTRDGHPDRPRLHRMYAEGAGD